MSNSRYYGWICEIEVRENTIVNWEDCVCRTFFVCTIRFMCLDGGVVYVRKLQENDYLVLAITWNWYSPYVICSLKDCLKMLLNFQNIKVARAIQSALWRYIPSEDSLPGLREWVYSCKNLGMGHIRDYLVTLNWDLTFCIIGIALIVTILLLSFILVNVIYALGYFVFMSFWLYSLDF